MQTLLWVPDWEPGVEVQGPQRMGRSGPAYFLNGIGSPDFRSGACATGVAIFGG